ncbi:hypothetical protein [Frateuria terrea]|uniref:Uncharacterized protein n=1 Tax=Frateuria terrea TaxID=529704 RepID=A0A1H6VLM1_9GAMM|nr:hypothetical protein [Frateuria terrea]SEJ05521.1 hypothetical protein SAMN04487997_2347 [Frateuria terrea]SFP62653.1 hypothetical protein SAMN02927913_2882 [Frateuria terrea]
MKTRELLSTKYNAYLADGNAVLAVTLSTYVRSAKFASSDCMRVFWDQHFMHRVQRCLPYHVHPKIDYDYVVERSPGGHYHYHGLLALPQPYGDWLCEGIRSKWLRRDLNSFRRAGQYRPLRLNSFRIEPIRPDGSVDAIARYLTKTPDYLPSSETYPLWKKQVSSDW